MAKLASRAFKFAFCVSVIESRSTHKGGAWHGWLGFYCFGLASGEAFPIAVESLLPPAEPSTYLCLESVGCGTLSGKCCEVVANSALGSDDFKTVNSNANISETVINVDEDPMSLELRVRQP